MESKIPKESETIAARRKTRIAEKLRIGNGVSGKRAWWSNGPLELLIIAFIFLLNFYLVLPFFGTSAVQTSFSGPVVPVLAKLIELFGVTTPYAYQIINIAFFVTFPLTFYMFVKRISDRKLIALFASLIASLPFYPFATTRIQQSLIGVEQPHIASLTLIPLALYGLMPFLHNGGLKNLFIAAVSSSLVALTSPFGFFTYLIFAGITTFSEILLGRGRLKMARFTVVLLIAGGLSSFWYNPAFFIWMIISPMGEDIRFTLKQLIPMSIFSLPVLATFGYLLFDRKPNLQPVFLASFYSIAFAMILIAGGGFVPSHPSRYIPELGLSLALLISIAATKLAEFIKFSQKFAIKYREKLSTAFLILFFLSLVGGIIIGRRSLLVKNDAVLGIWDDVNKGEIWVAKEKFRGGWTYLGYSITSTSLLGLIFMGIGARYSKKKEKAQSAKS
jgi:hypothetical protein